MTEEEKLAAYERMHRSIADEYASLSQEPEALKTERKTGTVSCREAPGRRMYCKSLLELYEKFGL